MAATARVGPCFSASVAPCIQPKNSLSDSTLRIGGLRAFRSSAALACSVEHLSIGLAPQRRRISRISAAVAQEKAAATETEVSEVTGTGESVEEKEVESGAEVGDVADASSPVNTKLYFGNMPYNCDSAQLAGVIQEYASPEMVEVLYDRDSGRSRGFAFVTMSSTEDCELVIQSLDGSQYGGRILRVNFSDKPKRKEPLYPETEFKLFVGNLSWSVTSESLNEVFQEYGNVVGARVLYDGETGRSRGYGFVCYSSKAEMDAALETLNGVELEGRAMRIGLALGKRS